MRKLPFIALTAACLVAAGQTQGQVIVDFESFDLGEESYYNGADLAGGFQASGIHFSNIFTPEFGSWSGFAYSNMTDTTTPGFGNQYSAIAGGGAGGSRNYGVAFVSDFSEPGVITLPMATTVESLAITNTTYAALSMSEGDSFAKKFGGDSGGDPDFLRLDILGLDLSGNQVGVVEFYLADFRFENTSQDFVLDEWRTVDLSPLGDSVASLQFAMETTDLGEFGPNTPFFFALDDLVVRSLPEPLAVHLLWLGVFFVVVLWRRAS